MTGAGIELKTTGLRHIAVTTRLSCLSCVLILFILFNRLLSQMELINRQILKLTLCSTGIRSIVPKHGHLNPGTLSRLCLVCRYFYYWRRISIHCKMIVFIWNTNSQAEQISLATVDSTHFKRKRAQKIDRATFCTEWKSALKGYGNIFFYYFIWKNF